MAETVTVGLRYLRTVGKEIGGVNNSSSSSARVLTGEAFSSGPSPRTDTTGMAHRDDFLWATRLAHAYEPAAACCPSRQLMPMAGLRRAELEEGPCRVPTVVVRMMDSGRMGEVVHCGRTRGIQEREADRRRV